MNDSTEGKVEHRPVAMMSPAEQLRAQEEKVHQFDRDILMLEAELKIKKKALRAARKMWLDALNKAQGRLDL